MTQLEADLLKIFVDKGLLGGLTALLAFYGSRFLERYKAQNIYDQHLAAKRIQAYEDLGEYLYRVFKLIKAMFQTIRASAEGNDNKTLKLQFSDSWSELVKVMESGDSHAARNWVFVSQNSNELVNNFIVRVRDLLAAMLDVGQQYQRYTGEPLNVVTDLRNHPEAFKRLKGEIEEIEQAYVHAARQLSEEVQRGPFRK